MRPATKVDIAGIPRLPTLSPHGVRVYPLYPGDVGEKRVRVIDFLEHKCYF
jgi:hypothetical protein